MAPGPARAASRWFRLTDHGWFHDWRTQLQELADENQGRPPSRICIVGWQQDGDPASVQAYVIWHARHRLITWFPSTDDPHSLIHETHVLDLWTDVVATQDQIAGSTYLVDRAWVHGIERHCRTAGTTLTLAPRKNADRRQE